MSTAAIDQARLELEQTRTGFRRARGGLLTAVGQAPDRPASEVVDEVAEAEQLDQAFVQKALWSLVQERVVELTETYTLRLHEASSERPAAPAVG